MLTRIKQILYDYTDVKEIGETSMLEADLGLSSLDVVSIVTEFEDVFHIEIPDRDIGKFIRVKDIIEYLEARV